MRVILSIAASFALYSSAALGQAAERPQQSVKAKYPMAQNYNPADDANAMVNAALKRAAVNGKRIIIVMGANWCHDSIVLAGWFDRSGFAAMMQPKFEIVYVDVGTPQTDNGRNMDIAKRFKAKRINGTPTVLILSAQGKLLNKKDAGTWRNAASRNEQDIFSYFADL